MKSASVLVLTLILGANYVSHSFSSPYTGANAPPNTSQKLRSAELFSKNSGVELSSEIEKDQNVPLAFRGTDFKNLAYPTSLRGWIRLQDGRFEYSRVKGTGGGDTFDFSDVHYVDLTGDGNKEALVRLIQISCGASCDGSSDLFYIYSGRQRRLRLLTRIETGSLAYGCGLKSLIVESGKISLEVFGKCHLKGRSLERFYGEEEVGKFEAKAITRFLFELKGRALVLQKREVFPYLEGGTLNTFPTIRIGYD